ncbi:putative nucleic acid-binding Zn-ribbon protein [Erwinia toletana]|uniref:Nucleic acid-binding Zn-ribbon protein n=1 Tax=Winslowiella toletana TaxID=92490 RepID=A0ABS4PDD1_9GAMM|nr:hypothetical protein [Winslowiella toletana]MBP2170649.1 putative nucleic acid-binding Zn-ribbon protein [Winslowiella toletana]
MESRVTRLESDVRHINITLTDMKQDIRVLRSDVKTLEEKMDNKLDAMDAKFSARFDAMDTKFSARFDAINIRFDSFQRWLVGILITSLIIPVVVAFITPLITK